MRRLQGFIFILGVLLSVGGSTTSRAESQESPHSHPQWSFQALEKTPILNGGRVKPLDSYAREVILFQTGSRKFQGWGAIDLMLSWIAFPSYWEQQPIIRVSREDVKRQLGLDESRVFFSPQELFKNTSLAQYAEKIDQRDPGSQPPGAPKNSPREQELKSVLDRLGVFHGVITGQSWTLVPKSSTENQGSWGNLLDTTEASIPIRGSFLQLIQSYQAGDSSLFEKASESLLQSVRALMGEGSESMEGKIQAEVISNQVRPFLWSWILYLAAAVTWSLRALVSSSKKQSWMSAIGFTLTLAAVGFHTFGFGLRCYVAGRPPVTNMYESIVWVSLGVAAFGGILYWLHRHAVILAVSCFLACFGLVAADAAPAILDPALHPLVPVLRSNYWLTVHVLTITLGYAAFALTLGLANITLFQFLGKVDRQKVNALNQFTYRAMQFGVVFIAAGTILGGIWADYSWGRFWGWDPKEVWALITLLCYLVILHGRYTNWMGQFGFAACSAVSFLSVVMAWYGVNFILGVGLHSYGFASGGTPWVLAFVALEMLYVGVISAVHYQREFRLRSSR